MKIELTVDQARSVLVSVEKELESYRRVPKVQRTSELGTLEAARDRLDEAIRREEWDLLDGAKAPQDIVREGK
jgi:hypothetical protein